MDREISKTERVASLRRSVLKYVAGAVVVALAAWGVFEWSRTSVKLADLKITTVSCGDIETTVTASAKVAPAFEEIIVSPISSRIVEVYHRPGDEVEAGTPLLRLDIEGARTAGAAAGQHTHEARRPGYAHQGVGHEGAPSRG